MYWIKTSKKFVLLKYQNLYNLITILKKNYTKLCLNISYILKNVMSQKKERNDICSDTTQSYFHLPVNIFYNIMIFNGHMDFEQ
jgi:hypothetical protein